MPRTKKTLITRDAAGELEELLADYTVPEARGFGNPKRNIQDLLRALACPKDVSVGIFARLDSITDDIRMCEDDMSRGSCEAVADSFKRLDEYLSKRFNVQMPRKNQTYRWMVG